VRNLTLLSLLLSSLAWALVACSGGGAPSVSATVQGGKGADDAKDEIDRRCPTNFAGGTVTFTASPDCPNCSVADTANAVDGQDATKAALTAPLASTGSMTLRATAPKGVAFAAGNAAVVLSVDQGSGVYVGASSVDPTNHQEWQVTLHTYLGDALQESDAGYISISDQAGQREIVGLNTTKPFDSMEVSFDRAPDAQRAMNNMSGAANTLETGSANVHEFCVNFDISGLQTH
jgi:hypothetical protein